jgi:hypothetical protein
MRSSFSGFIFLACLLLALPSMAQTPAGNYGNIQLNRNGVFDTPGSDSATFTGTGTNAGLQIKGTASFTGLVTASAVNSSSFYYGGGSINMNDGNAWTTLNYGNSSVIVQNGNIAFNTLFNNRLNLSNTAAIFNTGSADNDFQVKGQTDANLIYADASTNRVGIGTATPAGKLDVNGTFVVSKDLGNFQQESMVMANGVYGSLAGLDMNTHGLNIYTTSNHSLILGAYGQLKAALFPSGNFKLSHIWYLDEGPKLQVDGNTWIAGNLGLGTITAGAKLHVVGAVKIVDGTQQAGRVLGSDANGLASWVDPSGFGGGLWTAGTGKIYNTTLTNNVGIGTDAPAAKLDVSGNAIVRGSATIITGPTGSFNVGSYEVPSYPLSYDGSTGITTTHSLRAGALFTTTLGAVNIEGNIGHFYLHANATINGYQQAVKLNRVGFNGAGPTMEINDDGFYATNVGDAPAYKVLSAKYSNTEVAYIGGAGNAHFASSLTIGTTTLPTGYELAVKGEIIAEKVKVKLYTGWPDFVFQPQYELLTLGQVEQFIKANSHLPGVPSAAEIEKNGLDLGDGQGVLLKKIEELTLYMIEINKTVEKLVAENEMMKKQLNKEKM